MRKVALTISAGDADEVLDRLLPLVPQGVHDRPAGDGRLELAVYGDGPPLAELETAVGAALIAVSEAEVDDDPARRRLESYAARSPIGGRVVVRPEHAPPAAEGVLDVVIDGLGGAFGAGTHPTTAMCLELMLGLEPGGAFADLGCGTGVLAVVAAKLGWGPVLALDHEELAVEAAAANARRNAVDVEVLRADVLEIPPPPVGTLAANVPPKVHAHLAERLPAEVRTVIASGVDDGRLSDTVAAYARAGLAVEKRMERRSWGAVVLVRDG
jgi:ribosomal protein L11 methyltransferase